jgi:hypothetical protein
MNYLLMHWAGRAGPLTRINVRLWHRIALRNGIRLSFRLNIRTGRNDIRIFGGSDRGLPVHDERRAKIRHTQLM